MSQSRLADTRMAGGIDGPASDAAESLFPHYSRAERLADSIVHVLGVLAALIGAVTIMAAARYEARPPEIAGTMVYGLSLIAMTASSAAYNLVSQPVIKEWLRRLDHAVIYSLIAGTITPFLAASAESEWIVLLLSLVWVAAMVGIAMKLLWPRRFETLSVVLYLAMGWAGLAALFLVRHAVPDLSIALIAFGGLLFTGGVCFHLSARLPFHNALWHLCVLLGAGCHYAAVWHTVVAPPIAGAS